jgi:DNA-binding HxlR family transcriptional regulator
VTAGRFRAGGLVLSLLAAPLTVPILRAHADGPLRLPELRERVGGAAQTTLRGHVGNLRGIGALSRRVLGGMPYTVENELTEMGGAVLSVAEVVEDWLAQAPQGSIALGSEPAKGALRALIGGWGSTMLRALAARPLSLTELASLIGGLSYPAVERRLSAMRAARQVERLGGSGNSTSYVVTDWMRQAVAPLAAAGRCECRYIPAVSEPLTRIDVEAAFLLAVPLVSLSEQAGGSCLLGVDTGMDARRKSAGRLAGVRVKVEDGQIASCAARLERDPRTWALGTVENWLEALIDRRLDRLRLGGEDPPLASDLVKGLHDALFEEAGR